MRNNIIRKQDKKLTKGTIQMDNNLINVNLELLNKDRSKMTRKEKIRYAQELEFEALAVRNHWEGEEKELNKERFFEEKDRDRKLLNDSVDVLEGKDGDLSPFEKKQAEKYIRDNPDLVEMFDGMMSKINRRW